MYKKLEELGFFEWLDKVHNLVDTDMKPEYLDRLPLDDIHRTVCNAMAFRWFREKYGFHFYSYQIKLYPDGDYPTKIWHGKINDEFVNTENGLAKSHFYSYEEAENACIDKLIELAKQQ
jgi:hypothetical protein